MANVAAPSFVSLSALTVSDEFQMRLKLDRAIVSEYAEMVKESAGVWPFADPCSVYRVKDDLILVDGFHRVAAIRQAGEDQVSVIIVDGSRLDAKKAAFAANQNHGLRLSNADKRHKVAIALNDTVLQKWSDRKLAELCGVSNQFIANLRGELSTVDTSPPENTAQTKTGSDGKSYPASKPDADMQRKKIVAAVVADEDASDRKIAEMVGCDHKTVGKVRRELEEPENTAIAVEDPPPLHVRDGFNSVDAQNRIESFIEKELGRWPEDRQQECASWFFAILGSLGHGK